MIGVWMLVLMLGSHWVADFIMQNDEVAINKSKNWKICLLHSVIYTFSLMLLFSSANIIAYLFGCHYPMENWTVTEYCVFYLLNCFFHYGVDTVTSKINSWLWKKEERHWFFCCIGFDQFLHLSFMFVTFAKIKTFVIIAYPVLIYIDFLKVLWNKI